MMQRGTSLVLVLLSGCDRVVEAEAAAEATQRVNDRAALVRASLDLLGRRPDPDTLRDADASTLSALVAAASDDPDLGRRAAWLWNQSLHTAAWRDDLAWLADRPIADQRAIAWEPLAGIMAIVNEDRPFTEVLTASEWPANERLAALWDIPYTGTDGGWAWTRVEDGRPLAGILSSSALWMRYSADQTNFHRRRANMLARVFLCADFFDRDVQFEADAVLGVGEVEVAVREVPACVNCHAALDPMAAFLAGFTERSEPTELEQGKRYSPWVAAYGAAVANPGYFGHPGQDLTDLGAFMAADPRFARCVVRRTYEGLTHTSFDAEPDRDAMVRGFVDGGYRWDQLAAAVIGTDAWAVPALKRLPSDQYLLATNRALALPESETGAWSGLDEPLLDGRLRVLGGDPDDVSVLQAAAATAPAQLLYPSWVAELAVPEAVTLDRARPPANRVLLPAADDPTEDEVRAQLVTLFARLDSRVVEPDGAEVGGLLALWHAADQSWEEVLVALLRHPDARLY
ncbi:MAG: hypothetical protein EXR71_17385 [Myxococcales bacterium]|nr:hypothetical protein [Myxococcales bacterium]